MSRVYVVVSPSGFIWGVFTTIKAAEAEAAKHGGYARITNEPVIGVAA